MPTPARTPFSRIFIVEDGAGPANTPEYQGQAKAGAVAWAQGDITPLYIPDPYSYGQFKVVEVIRGAKGLPAIPVTARFPMELSDWLALVRKGCSFDMQVHMGKCRNPQDFNGGWDKVLVLEGAYFSDYGTGDIGALDPGEDAFIDETLALSGQNYYEVKRLNISQIGVTEIVQEIVDVTICDARSCGECGLPSNGCQRVFAITRSHGGSPGLPAELIYSEDGGSVLGETNISTLAANEDPSAMACVGIYLVVVSNEDCGIHYAEIADILLGTETWVRVATGLVCPAGAPNDLFSLAQSMTWLVGNGGYVYFSDDITAGVSVQDAGVATIQDLNAIHGFDEENLVAVGASNAVIYSRNGGSSWSAITGPAAGVALNIVWMKGKDEWFIGTAGGRLYYTRNGGLTWTEKAFPGSGSGQVRDIVFATPTVGYLAHDTALAVGRIMRSIDGGHSWYILPEQEGISFPDNDKINALAACADDVNVVYGGGLAGDATDGFFVKGS